MSVLICGDTHWRNGDEKKVQGLKLTNEDTLIILGDFGGIWYGDQRDEVILDEIAGYPFTIAFIDGNHENFDKLYSYPIETWNGGKVHRIRPNLVHMMRGEVFMIEGTTFFAFGGGYSIDKSYRVEGESWWPQEIPTQEEMDHGKERLSQVGYVDYVLTHTCPRSIVFQCFENPKFMVNPEIPLQEYLDEIYEKKMFKYWFFGHLHLDKDFEKISGLYRRVLRIRTGG